jgi:hypothetical protein
VPTPISPARHNHAILAQARLTAGRHFFRNAQVLEHALAFVPPGAAIHLRERGKIASRSHEESDSRNHEATELRQPGNLALQFHFPRQAGVGRFQTPKVLRNGMGG